MMPLRIIVGGATLLFIPGFLIVDLILPEESFVQKVGLCFVIGIALQLMIIMGIHTVGFLFFYKRMHVQATVIALNCFLMVVLSLLRTRYLSEDLSKTKENVSLKPSKKASDLRSNCILLIAFLLNLLIISFFVIYARGDWVDPDSAGFLDMGRGIVNAEFSSKNIGSIGSILYFENRGISSGHFGASFAYALFFMLAGVNIKAALLMNMVMGTLIMFPLYGATKELFGRSAAHISIFLAAIHPYLIAYSSLIRGPEILGTLLLISTCYFALLALKEQKWSKIFAVIAGIFLFLTMATADYMFFVFITCILLIFVSVQCVCTRRDVKNNIVQVHIGLFLLGGLFVTAWKFESAFLSSTPLLIWIIILTYPAINALIYVMRKRSGWMTLLHLMSLSCYALIILHGLRFYIVVLHPEFVKPLGLTPPSFLSSMFGAAGMPTAAIFEGFVEKLMILLKIEVFHWTALVTMLGLAALVVPIGWRKKVWVFVYPLIFTLIAVLRGSGEFFPPDTEIPTTLFPPVDLDYIRYIRFGWNNKIVLSLTPYILMASAAIIGYAEKVSRNTIPSIQIILERSLKRKIRKCVIGILGSHRSLTIRYSNRLTLKASSFVLVLFILLTIQFVPYFPYYGLRSWDSEHPATSYGHGYYMKNKPVYDWVKIHLDKNAVLMSWNPREVAWFTDRITVGILNPWGIGYEETVRGVNLTHILLLIRRYHVEYLIVEDRWDPKIPITRFLMVAEDAPPGFNVVFRQETPEWGGFVMLYNVSDIWRKNIQPKFLTLTVTSCNSTTDWSIFRGSGSPTVDLSDKGISFRGTTDSYGFFEVVYDPPGSWNWSTVRGTLNLWLKLDTPANIDSFTVTFYDINGTSHWYKIHHRYEEKDWKSEDWFLVSFPLHAPDVVEPENTTIDMEQIDEIHIRIHNPIPIAAKLHVGNCTLELWSIQQ